MKAGLFESAMHKLFTRSAQVLDIEDIGGAYRLVTLGGPALRNIEWTPGDKIQIQLGGWVQRTYTPMDWDAKNGRTRILVYLHGSAPGTQWARTLRKGDACVVFGPRRSIKLAGPRSPVIVCGDETSLGLAVALSNQRPPAEVLSLFEVSALADTVPVIEHLQLAGARVCARLDGERHLAELETHLSALLETHATADLVLTGKAGTIQHIGRLLRQRDIAAGRRQSKAYWAPGKAGLD
ncbi:siderophore-interacting protein [Janthinobacterium sp. HH01]|uniref:siderophore-interacting protein n=1 Tax=Janthinobacterium sp. HH01 TaxID=1198452 RepID=UPI0002AEC75F|nr:siderophore-interacting protein [Janthinobacterium sp. HH01]ELX09505.1 siderophore-interacting protein [Janthinobacterium sp. HH01]